MLERLATVVGEGCGTGVSGATVEEDIRLLWALGGWGTWGVCIVVCIVYVQKRYA